MPDQENALLDRDCSTLARMVAESQISAVELTNESLHRIEDKNPRLNAFITVNSEDAVAQARTIDKRIAEGENVGPLAGVPFAVKDVIPTAGLRTTYGSRQFEDNVPLMDAISVSRAKRAGAICIGKASTPEFASYMNTRNELVGTTLHPWNNSLSSGGSSGGPAVAVAAGMSAFGLGTDHGGSVRLPAAFNSLYGLRPTPGTVPVYPSPWVHDPFDVQGPLARSPQDISLIMKVISGPDSRVPTSLSVPAIRHAGENARNMKVAWTEDLNGLMPVEREIRKAVQRTAYDLAALGLNVQEASPDLRSAAASIAPIRAFRALIEHADRLDRLTELDNPLLINFLEWAKAQPARDLAAGFHDRSSAWLNNHDFFDRFDILLLPTSQFVSMSASSLYPAEIDGVEIEDPLLTVTATYAITMMGWCGLSIPSGLSTEGVPLGVQLVAAPGNDSLLLSVASELHVRFPDRFVRPPGFN